MQSEILSLKEQIKESTNRLYNLQAEFRETTNSFIDVIIYEMITEEKRLHTLISLSREGER